MSLSLSGRLGMSGRLNAGYYDEEQHSPYYQKIDSYALGKLYDLFYETKTDPGDERLEEIIDECSMVTASYIDDSDRRILNTWGRCLNGTKKERQDLVVNMNTCIAGAIYMACEDDYIIDQVPFSTHIKRWVKNGCR